MAKIIALICEFNPIHSSHKYVIGEAKKHAGEDGAVICVMSGNFTQRCTPAVFDKYTRARAAISCGADLVVELPFPYSSSGAEDFSRGGVSVASNMRADALIFATESGDADKIKKAAEIKSSPEFRERMRSAERDADGIGSAVIFDSVMRDMGLDSPLGANDKLGGEYMRFGMERGISEYIVLPRIAGCKSASEIRGAIFAGCLNSARAYIPVEAYDVFASEEARICREDRFFGVIFDYCRLYACDSTNPLIRYAHRIACESVDSAEFISNLATKKYTAARMRREILFSILGVASMDVNENALHTVLLGANARGREYLAGLRKTSDFPIITKPADDSALDTASREAYRRLKSADELYCLCSGLRSGYFMKQHPAFL